VRRSSDDAEQDIGYDSNGEDLDTFGLLAFVNAEKDKFISDFPNGTTAGSGDSELRTTRTTLTAPSSIGGQTDALQVTCDGTTSFYDMRVNLIDSGQQHDVSFEYYIPSGNTIVEGIRFTDLSGVGTFSTKGAWTSVTLTDKTATNDILRFFAADSGGGTSIGSGVTESFYIRNLSVSQTTADGHVTTWYDQTGNGNHATNSTASEQGLIVEAGDIIYEGATISRPAIEFDGVDDHFTLTAITVPQSEFFITDVVSNISTGFTAPYGANSSDAGLAYPRTRERLEGQRLTTNTSVTDWCGAQGIYTVEAVSGSYTPYENGVARGTALSISNTYTIRTMMVRRASDLLGITGGKLQERIIYLTDQSANRNGIERNIDTYFRITS